MGRVSDPEKDPIEVNQLTIRDEITATNINWIKLISEESDGTIKLVIFEYEVPEDTNISYDILLIISLKDEPKHPLGKTASSGPQTISIKVFGNEVDQISMEKEENLKDVLIHSSFYDNLLKNDLNKEGEIALTFDREIRVSNYLANLTSENEGTRYITVEYKMSSYT